MVASRQPKGYAVGLFFDLKLLEIMSQSLRPKDAASLVLIRYSGIHPEVLLGQRHASHAFMPNSYVFPGGRVDANDSRVRPATSLGLEVAQRLGKSCGPARARAISVAAIRETYEETGLMLARPMPNNRPTSKNDAWVDFCNLGLGPALNRLDYVCRAITPPGRSRRFHARFFMADAAFLQGDIKSSGELLDIKWVALTDAIAMPIPSITRHVIKEVMNLIEQPPVSGEKRTIPVYQQRYGQDIYHRE